MDSGRRRSSVSRSRRLCSYSSASSRSRNRSRSRSRSRSSSLVRCLRNPDHCSPDPRLLHFDGNLAAACRRLGTDVLRLPVLIDCLPFALADMVRYYHSLTVLKLVRDHLLRFDVVESRGPVVVVELLRPRPPAPVCPLWSPDRMTGCRQGAECRDRHDLPPLPML